VGGGGIFLFFSFLLSFLPMFLSEEREEKPFARAPHNTVDAKKVTSPEDCSKILMTEAHHSAHEQKGAWGEGRENHLGVNHLVECQPHGRAAWPAGYSFLSLFPMNDFVSPSTTGNTKVSVISCRPPNHEV